MGDAFGGPDKGLGSRDGRQFNELCPVLGERLLRLDAPHRRHERYGALLVLFDVAVGPVTPPGAPDDESVGDDPAEQSGKQAPAGPGEAASAVPANGEQDDHQEDAGSESFGDDPGDAVGCRAVVGGRNGRVGGRHEGSFSMRADQDARKAWSSGEL